MSQLEYRVEVKEHEDGFAFIELPLELLDELGIVLRLENATRKYALTIGKTKEELNAYERTQAVLNDVLEQAERKFGRIAEIMDPKAFAFSQLTTDMDDMLVSFKQGLAKTLIPVLIFLKENILN